LPWAADRDHDAKPASATGGQPWVLKKIQQGDTTCKANQALHAEAVNTVARARANNFYVPAVADPVSPITFVHKIRVPVYLACQFTDEQTGGHCPDLASHFTGTARKWFTFTNGVHTDSLDPDTFTRWYDFLELFVARQAPNLPAAVKAGAPVLYQSVQGVNGVTLPRDPIQGLPSYGAALAAFERLPPVRILFDNGAGSATPGNPVPGFERSFPRFPLPGTTARSWYLNDLGELTDSKPSGFGNDAFTWNKAARPATDFSGDTGGGPGGLWNAIPPYHWTQNPVGTAVSYVSSPLTSNAVVVGGGAAQLWVKASTPDVDLQVTVTEVRPTRRSSRAGGCARASASSIPPAARSSRHSRRSDAPTWRRFRRARSPWSRCRSTTRATHTGRGHGSGSSSLPRTAINRSGRSGTSFRPAVERPC
jgi:hypothetical protein